MKRKALWMVPLLLVIVSCATVSFQKAAFVTLSESKDLYELSMTVVADFQKQGIINQVKRDQINKAAKIYKEAHNVAVDALAVYKKTSAAVDKDKLIVALSTAASKWQSVAALINAIKPGSVPDTFSK